MSEYTLWWCVLEMHMFDLERARYSLLPLEGAKYNFEMLYRALTIMKQMAITSLTVVVFPCYTALEIKWNKPNHLKTPATRWQQIVQLI